MIIKRRNTRQINVGGVKIGGGATVSIQSMSKTDTRDVKKTVTQIKQLEKAGCEIVRVAVKDIDAARAIKRIKTKIHIPLAADIHFDYRLALEAVKNGADKIRLNPGNIKDRKQIQAVVKAAKARRIPIRIGINSGSFSPGEQFSAMDMVGAVLGYIRLFERLRFYNTIVSLKASDIPTTVQACRRFSDKSDYPLHLGVTAAGLPQDGLVKSAIGIGALLLDGIGDTIRVSLTGDPVLEIDAAKQILQAAGIRSFIPQIISCPTCGRCQVDLVKIAEELKEKIRRGTVCRAPAQDTTPLQRAIKIAVMGCEVNGPGEAKDADIGIAAGKNSGMLFKNGRPVKRVAEKDFVKVLLKEIQYNKGVLQ